MFWHVITPFFFYHFLPIFSFLVPILIKKSQLYWFCASPVLNSDYTGSMSVCTESNIIHTKMSWFILWDLVSPQGYQLKPVSPCVKKFRFHPVWQKYFDPFDWNGRVHLAFFIAGGWSQMSNRVPAVGVWLLVKFISWWSSSRTMSECSRENIMLSFHQ